MMVRSRGRIDRRRRRCRWRQSWREIEISSSKTCGDRFVAPRRRRAGSLRDDVVHVHAADPRGGRQLAVLAARLGAGARRAPRCAPHRRIAEQRLKYEALEAAREAERATAAGAGPSSYGGVDIEQPAVAGGRGEVKQRV